MPSSSAWRSGPSRRAMPARMPDDDGAAGDCDWAMATEHSAGRVKTGGNLTEAGGGHNAAGQRNSRRPPALEFPGGACIKSPKSCRPPSRRNAMISHHDALIYTMVLVSAASNMPDVELTSIGDAVMHLPVFRDFDRKTLPKVTNDCTKLLQDGDGLDKAFKAIKAALPEKLRETAYALACDVAAADGKVTPEESRILELIRHHLQIGRLPAAAIERGSRARHTHL